MQTGVISAENFSQVLRGLSQKRKHGVLEIQYAEKRVDVSFVQGKIVEANLFDVNPVHEVVGMLRAAGLISGDLDVGWDQSYDAVFKAIAARDPELGVVEEITFKRVVKHRILDLLYCVVANEGGYYNFRTVMVECSKHFSPSISVGQLLLDVVSLQTEGDKFNQVCREGVTLSRSTEERPEGLTDEEYAIFDTLKESLSLEELRLKSLLSLYHFQESVLSLISRGVVSLSEHGVVSEKLLGENFLSNLDSSIDDVFASLDEDPEAAESDRDLEDASVREARSERTAEVGEDIDQAADTESDEDSDEYEEEEVSPSLKVRIGLLSFRLLNQNWVPHTITVLALLAGCVVPFLSWGKIFAKFGY